MELPRRSSLSLLRILPRKLRGLVASHFTLAPKAGVSRTDDEDEDDDEDDGEEDEESPPLSGIKLAGPAVLAAEGGSRDNAVPLTGTLAEDGDMLEGFACLLPMAVAQTPIEVPDWSGWAYVYGVGGVAFALGLLLCLRTRAIDLRERRGRRALALMIAGFVGYALLQGVMQMALPRW